MAGARAVEVPTSMWMLGLGVGVFDSAYAGSGSNLVAFPLVAYIGARFEFTMRAATYTLAEHESWSIGVVAEMGMGGYDDDDSVALRGMDDRNMTLEVGATAAYTAAWGTLTLTVVTDVLGVHEGQEARLTYSRDLGRGYAQVIGEAGLKWKSRALVDYYYGVEAQEARPDRPAYSPGSTICPVASLTVRMPVSRHWSVLVIAAIEWLSDEIADSPIVDRDYGLTTIMGVSYVF